MCGYFGTKKKSGSNRCSPLNSSIDNKGFISTNAKFLENDYMNDYTPRSRVVLVEMNEPVIEQPMDETRDDVAVLNTPQDSTYEMTGTQVPRHSGRIIRPPI